MARSGGGRGLGAPAEGPSTAVRVAVLAVIAALVVAIGLQLSARASAPDSGQAAGAGGATALDASDQMQPEPQPVSLTVTFAGDCTLGTDAAFDYSTSLNAKYEEVGDPSYFLRNVEPIFAADDLTIVNMEGTLTTASTRADKTFAFKGPAEFAKILSSSSVEGASLANNHSRDYGEQSYQ
ncbi:MAG: hypothetical protein HFJ75_07390, partial [Eggerthellaceae bacterium]|nr:hypothetical protein [Eggerthellaceae bacterium]